MMLLAAAQPEPGRATSKALNQLDCAGRRSIVKIRRSATAPYPCQIIASARWCSAQASSALCFFAALDSSADCCGFSGMKFESAAKTHCSLPFFEGIVTAGELNWQVDAKQQSHKCIDKC